MAKTATKPAAKPAPKLAKTPKPVKKTKTGRR